jgi:hypothetical protein
MIRILQSISTRERVMLTAFVVVALLIWASLLSGRWETNGNDLREARREVAQQQIWIDSAALFQAQLDQTLTQLDSTRMLDGSDLTAFVDTYAREKMLTHEMSSPQVQRGNLFTQTSLRITFRNISLEELIQFQLAVDQRRPYLTVEAIALAANRADPRLINARLNLNAILVTPDA